MKTALSFMLALLTTTAPHRAAARTEAAGAGRLVLALIAALGDVPAATAKTATSTIPVVVMPPAIR